MISIILPSYLETFERSAKNREQKLHRAIDSVLKQTYKDYELIIIADGCQKTVDISLQYSGENIRGFYVDKQEMFSGIPRNVGLDHARGDIICYLDSDDMFGENHLHTIATNFDKDWVFFNDMRWSKDRKAWYERKCFMKRYKCGTSNFAHKQLPIRWNIENKYGSDDWEFLKLLKRYEHKQIPVAEYLVCHIPNLYDI